MPARVQDLLVEVQRFQGHVLPQSITRPPVLRPSLVTGQRTTNLLRFECRLVRLQYNVIESLAVKYPEVVVVRPGENVPARKEHRSQWPSTSYETLNGITTQRAKHVKTRTHLSSPLHTHSNLSKMQSFSYKSHNLPRRWSWMGMVFNGRFSMLMSQILRLR